MLLMTRNMIEEHIGYFDLSNDVEAYFAEVRAKMALSEKQVEKSAVTRKETEPQNKQEDVKKPVNLLLRYETWFKVILLVFEFINIASYCLFMSGMILGSLFLWDFKAERPLIWTIGIFVTVCLIVNVGLSSLVRKLMLTICEKVRHLESELESMKKQASSN